MHRDRSLFGVALGKVVALKKARKRVSARELDEAFGAQLVAPLGVVAHLGLLKIKHEAGLRKIGLGVDADLFV